MNELVVTPVSDLAAASTADLRHELARALDITAKHLTYLATIWAELESRGEDLSDLRHGIATYLPMIANNRINADLVVKYAGQKTLLAALAELPIEEQNRVAETGTVSVVVDAAGERVTIETPLAGLSAAQVHQVFSDDGVRSPDEQIALIEATPKFRRSSTRRRIARKIAVEDIDGIQVINVGGKRVRISTVIETLKSEGLIK